MNKVSLGLLGIFVLAAMPQTVIAKDFLAEARTGKLLCMVTSQEKVCAAVAKYSFSDAGMISETTETVVNANPVIVHVVQEETKDDGDNHCRIAHKQVIEKGVFLSGGEQLSSDVIRESYPAIFKLYEKIYEKNVCLFEMDTSSGIAYDYRVDGVTLDLPFIHITWIGPNDGYRLDGSAASKLLVP